MSIIDSVKGWVFGIALKKMVVSAAKLIVSWAIAHSVAISVNVGGVLVNTQDEAALILAINTVLTGVRNWLKIRFPKQCSWL